MNNIDILDDNSILEIILKISNFDDLDNFCKSSKRIRHICKERKLTICKALLENLGYSNFSKITESPCKLMLKLRVITSEPNTRTVKRWLNNSDQILRLLAINNKIDRNILYNICSEIINHNQFKLLKKFTEFTDYDFQSGNNPSLLALAALYTSFTDRSQLEWEKRKNIVQYILDHGGNVDEGDITFLQQRQVDSAIINLIKNAKVTKKSPFVVSDEISRIFGFE